MRLSPSTLNLFLECPKCFYMELKMGIHRPQGPFPSLPGGMDGLIKKYFDKYRLLGQMPPEIEGRVEGAQLFPDVEVLNQWRNWRTGLSYQDKETGATLSGALDDCLVQDKKYMPMDYKTRGYDVKEGGERFYQNQMDSYDLLLQKNGFKTAGWAWLIYWIPKEIQNSKGKTQNYNSKIKNTASLFEENNSNSAWVRFVIDPKKMKTDADSALKVFRDAVKLLEGPMPKAHSVCTFCSWASAPS